MALGPIEILVIEFPGNQFTGAIIPELESQAAPALPSAPARDASPVVEIIRGDKRAQEVVRQE